MNINKIISEGYSVLPKLQKFGSGAFFVKDDQFRRYQNEKLKTLFQNKQTCIAQNGQCNFSEIIEFFNQNGISGNSLANFPLQIQEDFVVHRINNKRDWVEYLDVRFPSGWDPAKIVGKSMYKIHRPVPSIDIGYKMAEAMVYKGPFYRYVWSPIYENRLNFHPSHPYKEFNIDNPQFLIKLEKQFTVGFPKSKMALFIIRQYLFDEELICKKTLYNALQEMSDEHKKYKNVKQDFLNWLKIK